MLLADLYSGVLTICSVNIDVHVLQSATDKAARWDLHARRTASFVFIIFLPCFSWKVR